MILINFKSYKETLGEGAIKLAKICQKVAKETGTKVYPVVRELDAYRMLKEVGVEVYLQQFALGAKEIGVTGSLINHSDYRLPPGTIKGELKSWPDDFESIVCLQTLGQMERWGRKLKTSYLAYEPKELIGNREKSVSSEYAKVIEKMVKMASPTPVLVGAGIHCREDVVIARKAGAVGILVATDVVKAEDPEKELRELAEAFSV